MKFSIDESREIRNGLEGSFSGVMYPSIFVPLVVDSEDVNDPWKYDETWIAFYFSRPLFPIIDKDRGYFDGDIELCCDDYLTCYRKVETDAGERYVKEIVEIGVDERDDICDQLIADDEENNTIINAVSKCILKYDICKDLSKDGERSGKIEEIWDMLDYRKVH